MLQRVADCWYTVLFSDCLMCIRYVIRRVAGSNKGASANSKSQQSSSCCRSDPHHASASGCP